MTPKTILIGLPSASGLLPTSTFLSLLQLHKPLPCGFMSVEKQRVERARNFIVAEALTQNFDYLFFVDDDNPVPADTLERFLEDDKDVVIAPILGRYPDKNGNFQMCAYYGEERVCENEKLRFYEPIKTFRDPGPLHKIDAGGTGCMLIKRKVLEVLNEKYPKEVFAFGDVVVGGQRRTMSEDVEFCERAVDAGFEIWLDERVRPVHLTQMRQVQWSP